MALVLRPKELVGYFQNYEVWLKSNVSVEDTKLFEAKVKEFKVVWEKINAQSN